MSGLKLSAFAGFSPRTSPTLLKDNEAQIALNTKLYSGELRAWNQPGELTVPAACVVGALSLYKHTSPTGDDLWLSWSTDVNVVPGPVYASGEYPIYYTGDGAPKKTNAALSASGSGAKPGAYLMMGVPAPTVAPSVAVATMGATGSNVTAQSQVYVFTHISEFGSIEEESAPSPASAIVSINPGGSVTVGNLPGAPPPGAYNITKIRLYRSVAGTSTNVYLKVTDIPIGTTAYVDGALAAALGEQIPSATWTPPPDDMIGITMMANGIMAGFRGNEVYFCEPYLPHAWPVSYMMEVEYPIVGIVAMGESLLVATKGNPFLISGTAPASMSQSKLPLYEPCVSKRSVAADEVGGMYVSPNGVIRYVTADAVAINASRTLFTRDEWSAYAPSTMLGVVLDGRYHLFFQNVAASTQGALILDRNDRSSPLTQTSMFTTGAYVEPTSASLFVVDGGSIKMWGGDTYTFLPYQWKSKMFILPRPLNFGAAQIEGDFDNIQLAQAAEYQLQSALAANRATFNSGISLQGALGADGPLNQQQLDGSILQTLPTQSVDQRYVNLTVFCQGQQVASINVKSSAPFRLPSGFKGDKWEFQLTGNIPVRHLKLAETSSGLVKV